eukprot:6816853-Prymnesium_polylepis.1
MAAAFDANAATVDAKAAARLYVGMARKEGSGSVRTSGWQWRMRGTWGGGGDGACARLLERGHAVAHRHAEPDHPDQLEVILAVAHRHHAARRDAHGVEQLRAVGGRESCGSEQRGSSGQRLPWRRRGMRLQ